MPLFAVIFMSLFYFIFVLSIFFYLLELFFIIYDEIVRIFNLKRSSKIKKFDIFEDEDADLKKEKELKNNLNSELYNEDGKFDNKLGKKYFFRLVILCTLLSIICLILGIHNVALNVALCGTI